jgi:dihydrofolate synthase/folylpolyglutamate synthase
MGRPDRTFKSVLVTGSNGKGTTSAVLTCCLEELGWKTGLFTSPHLVSVRERFRVKGKCAPPEACAQFLRQFGARSRELGATYFEVTTAFALWWFAQQEVDWAVLEIGLGGRWDACNAVDPVLSIVTSVSLEHTGYLGRTQGAIATEKARVARAGRPLLAGPLGVSAQRALRSTVRELGGHLLRTGHDIRFSKPRLTLGGSRFTVRCGSASMNLQTRMLGSNAAQNSGLAAAAAWHIAREHTALAESECRKAIARGVSRARFRGRLDVLGSRPLLVVDVAHNAAAVATLVADWRTLWPRKRPVIVAGLLEDKPDSRIGALLSEIALGAVITRADSPRAIPPEALAESWRRHFENVEVWPRMADAWKRAQQLAGSSGCVLVTGSHFVVGPFLAYWRRAEGRRRAVGRS